MKSYWLNKQNNKNLIVFFAGWSFDENPFKTINCEDYDVLIIYDYNELSIIPNELNNLSEYENKTLITWSMGAFAAYLHKNLFKDFNYKIAVNGTVTPVDNEFGIPIRMFELTLKHAEKGLEGKFYQNVFSNEEEFEIYSKTPVQRSIENRVCELENLYDFIKITNVDYEKFYDFAIVSEFDKIIPPKNQLASHKSNNVPVIELAAGHFPFYKFSSWKEVVNANR